MMINRRLIDEVGDTKKYIGLNVMFQWIGLIANIIIIFRLTVFLQSLYKREVVMGTLVGTVLIIILGVFIRFICSIGAAKMSFKSSETIKIILRDKIYNKILRIGITYKSKLSTAEILQVFVEGVDQLQTYFGSYLPQFFYSMLAPVTLFVALSFVNVCAAAILLVCVPLIPITIAIVQTYAKKLLVKYWSQYTTLGDTFLENLQGLTTLKIYQADQYKNDRMNQESEKFRKITMKVLTMQLNSVTVMDVIAFGGAALGISVALIQYNNGKITLSGCLAIVLLSAEFFIPMRLLGSYFHIAMNGMAASDKIYSILDLDETDEVSFDIVKKNIKSITLCNVGFSYNKKCNVLKEIDMEFKHKSFTAIVGESGCGKSTIASVLTGTNKGYTGSIKFDDNELSKISDKSLHEHITYVSFDSYLFKGTVRDNLLIACENAEEETIWNVLNHVKLSDFLKSERGLDTMLTERASNLSGGQRQRLSLARAILHDTPIYIFDEATSNIDVESEDEILEQIYKLARRKTVIFITHRLANVCKAHNIFVLENGTVCQSGKHNELMLQKGSYKTLWNAQFELENYKKEVADEKKK